MWEIEFANRVGPYSVMADEPSSQSSVKASTILVRKVMKRADPLKPKGSLLVLRNPKLQKAHSPMRPHKPMKGPSLLTQQSWNHRACFRGSLSLPISPLKKKRNQNHEGERPLNVTRRRIELNDNLLANLVHKEDSMLAIEQPH